MAKVSKKPASESRITKNAPAGRKKATHVSDELKRQMVAEAAFYNSQKRALLGGDPLQDWLMAEKQIEQQLTH